MRRKIRARLNIQIDKVDQYRLLKTIITGAIFHNEPRGAGWSDLRGLVTGQFFNCRFCREDDPESQRALWQVFRRDILKAKKKYAPGQKVWAQYAFNN